MLLPKIVLHSAARAGRRPLIGRFISSTTPLLEKKTIKVPTMGDSITEGTIVEWTAAVGQAVQPDDVVALVETDKVTVEIKAELAGVLTQQFGQVDETVLVGADLYEIDTEGEATVEASSSASSSSEAAPEAAPAEEEKVAAAATSKTPEAPKNESTSNRTPSIHFLGKDGWAVLKSATNEDGGGGNVQHYALPPSYGRPILTEEEMEALLYGGANLEPEVVATVKF